MRNTRFSLLAPLILVAALAGCHHKAPPPASPHQAQAGIVVTGGRLVLPAVPGHPGVAYLTLVNQGNSPATITAVSVDGAGQAEMHETMGTTTDSTMEPLRNLSIRAGGSAILGPGGKHIMVFDLAPRLVPHGTTPVTLVFSDVSKLNAPLAIEAAGGMGGMGAMAGMKM